ncbi:hypothetical protein [Sphaerisporangium corydalis]|uniref:XRE family transcriptional regulator n=1 Tax=Sphaerisporangium corydalis TaxID=1441875 RepID=A0ABV9EQN0_9ACTN|nr:hypothetical protein [Sphaerisporangium corydalis]
MTGEGYRILLGARRRADVLRAKGFTYDQIADVLALDHQVSPLRLYRFAHGRTVADVVNAFNDLDPAGAASLRDARLYDYEIHPGAGRKPPVRALTTLARIYQTTARNLVGDDEYATYGPVDRQALNATDYRHLDPCRLSHHTRLAAGEAHASMDTTAGRRTTRTSDAPYGLSPGDCAEVLRALSAEEADVRRRELLFELALALGGPPALSLLRHLAPDEGVRLAQALRTPGRVDAVTVTSLEKLIAHCWRLDETHGPATLIHMADTQRDLVSRLLKSYSLSPTLRDRLTTAYWSLSHLGGWLHFDLLDYPGAVRRYTEGLEAAHELGNPTLLAHIHGLLADAASYQGRWSKALDHAYAAQGWVKESNSRLQHAATSVALARTLAEAGNASASLRALDHACDRAGDGPTEVDPSHLYWCTPSRVQRHSLYCLVMLKHSDQAVYVGEQVLREVEPSFGRQRGFVLIDVATALIQKREIAGAASQLGEAASITARHSSMRLVHSLRATRRLLQPWATNTYVRDLDDQLQALGLSASPSV